MLEQPYGEDIHFNDLRDKLVTENTKKNNTEYVTLANNIKLYREEKRKQQNLASPSTLIIVILNPYLVI